VESKGLQVVQPGERTNTEGKPVSNLILLSISDSDYSSLRPHLEYVSLPNHLVACRSEFVTADAAGGVGVFPLDGPSIGGIGIDVAAEFASQVGNRGEDAACDDLAFDLGEPDLDLIEPGRVRGREVKPDSRMLLEELADRLSFVGGEIVEDDVNLLPRRAQGYDLLQKGDELATGMAGSGFAVDATGGGIQRCI